MLNIETRHPILEDQMKNESAEVSVAKSSPTLLTSIARSPT